MIAALFPGQGAQYPGLLHDVAREIGSTELFDRASEILGLDVLASDDALALERTEIVQRNTFLASVATANALRAGDVRIDVVAGHSIGVFAAAVCAAVVTFADGLRLVDLRGRLMAERFSVGYAMGAIVGFDEPTVETLIAPYGQVYVSGVNERDQVTIVGESANVLDAIERARALGARTAKLLPVTVPSHSPFMAPVRDALAAAIERIELGAPRMPYAANSDGRVKIHPSDIAADLVASVSLPVRWFDATQMLVERGVTSFIEASPGDALTRLIIASHPSVAARSVDRLGIERATEWARSRYG